jgi:hypothetical protein
VRTIKKIAQEYHQSAVDQLLAASDATRSKFLDLQFLRNRRAKSSTHRSRAWFSTVDHWLEGTRADQQEDGMTFFPEEVCCANFVCTRQGIGRLCKKSRSIILARKMHLQVHPMNGRESI